MANSSFWSRLGSYEPTMTSHLWESHLRKFLFPPVIHLEWVSIIPDGTEGTNRNSRKMYWRDWKFCKADSRKCYVIGVAYDLLLFWYDKRPHCQQLNRRQIVLSYISGVRSYYLISPIWHLFSCWQCCHKLTIEVEIYGASYKAKVYTFNKTKQTKLFKKCQW